MALIIREWTEPDLPSIQHIAWTTWLATYGTFIPQADMRTFFNEYYTIEKLAQFCHDNSAKGFVGELDAAIVGFAKTVYKTDEKKCYLNSLYILPAYQSKGIGAELLNASEDFAVSRNVSEIWLGVMVQNSEALRWYRKIGFDFVNEEPFTMGNTTVNHLIGYRTITRKKSDGK